LAAGRSLAGAAVSAFSDLSPQAAFTSAELHDLAAEAPAFLLQQDDLASVLAPSFFSSFLFLSSVVLAVAANAKEATAIIMNNFFIVMRYLGVNVSVY
jgi:hypothetical protein